MRGPIILKKISFCRSFTVKFERIIFVNMFLQIISITPCELAFNSLETHGLHVHTRMLIWFRFYSLYRVENVEKLVKKILYIHAVLKKIIISRRAPALAVANRALWLNSIFCVKQWEQRQQLKRRKTKGLMSKNNSFAHVF